MDIIKQLNWRYATKKFDPTKKVAPADFEKILEAARLAPSSFGIQPWKFIVVNDPKVRTQMRAAAWNQTQVTDASHLIVFAARDGLTQADIERFVKDTATQRGIPIESLNDYKGMMLASLKRSPEELKSWNARQTYIALGFALETAALMGIDACPMEGFDPAQIDEILKLKKEGYTSLALLAVGYRASDDKAAGYKKVRYAHKDVVKEI